MKIISGNIHKDRWDELLEKTTTKHQINYVKDEFAFFDSGEDGDDRVYMDDEKLVIVSEKPHFIRRDDDLLKQIFDKEFSPKNQNDETLKLIQKPPRKSLENRKSLESLNSKKSTSNCSSRYSMRFDD